MHIAPNKEGMSPFEIFHEGPYEIPTLMHTPATEAEHTLPDNIDANVKNKVLPPYLCDVVLDP